MGTQKSLEHLKNYFTHISSSSEPQKLFCLSSSAPQKSLHTLQVHQSLKNRCIRYKFIRVSKIVGSENESVLRYLSDSVRA